MVAVDIGFDQMGQVERAGSPIGFAILPVGQRPTQVPMPEPAEAARGATQVESPSAHDAALEANLREWIVAVVLPHVHGHDEECMVLEGEVRVGDLVVKQGAYHLAPRGVAHEPTRSESGAPLFLRGAIPAARQVRWGRAVVHALTGW